MQMVSLSERLKQEENRHQQTKESIIEERKELSTQLEAYVQKLQMYTILTTV